jgi:hypothetical protein
MWGAYKRDPEGYVTALRAHRISHVTGQMLVQEEAQVISYGSHCSGTFGITRKGALCLELWSFGVA